MPRPHTLPKFLALPVALVALLWGTPSRATADVLHLAGGGRLDGILVEESATRLTLEVSTGRVTIPRNRVLTIERTESALATFRARLATTPPASVDALAALGRFADANGLAAESRSAWTRVLLLDPSNAEAHGALGHVVVGGTWMERDEAYRAKGLIPFEGRWVTPAEQDAVLRERERQLERERRATEDRRVQEARREAREAEDRARRAEAEAARARNSAVDNSGWGYGGPVITRRPVWYGGGVPCLRLPCESETPRPAPAPTPAPLPPARGVKPSSIR